MTISCHFLLPCCINIAHSANCPQALHTSSRNGQVIVLRQNKGPVHTCMHVCVCVCVRASTKVESRRADTMCLSYIPFTKCIFCLQSLLCRIHTMMVYHTGIIHSFYFVHCPVFKIEIKTLFLEEDQSLPSCSRKQNTY